MSRIVVVSGGIGSGKSTVCRVLETMGYEVYDCDSRAKAIMDASDDIRRAIAEDICSDAVSDGVIDRKLLAEKVFSDERMLSRLNAVVHSAVRDDIEKWASTRSLAFVETALLYQSGIDRMADEVWEVVAPDWLRIERVMSRNGIGRNDVERRIASQNAFVPEKKHDCVYMIVNDGIEPVLPRIETLVSRLSV